MRKPWGRGSTTFPRMREGQQTTQPQPPNHPAHTPKTRQAGPSSSLLTSLVGGGVWEEMEGALAEMESAADWKVRGRDRGRERTRARGWRGPSAVRG
jgi:hypothetical protein